eukprot:149082_1
MAGRDIIIDDEHDHVYNLVLYEDKYGVTPVSNAAPIRFSILKEENEFPPKNTSYKPNCIDLTNLYQVPDEKNKTVNIYWSIPTGSFGDISYTVIHSTTRKEITCLPYCLSFSSATTTFTVVTNTKVDNKVYSSKPSKPIIVEQFNYHQMLIHENKNGIYNQQMSNLNRNSSNTNDPPPPPPSGLPPQNKPKITKKHRNSS